MQKTGTGGDLTQIREGANREPEPETETQR
jgi:hypothetical protein